MKIAQKCSRCSYEALLDVATAADAEKLEAKLKKKTENKAKIVEFFKTLGEDVPDYVAVMNGKVVVHDTVCDGQGKKRSCLKRLDEILGQADQLDERAPRTKKAKVEGEPIALTDAVGDEPNQKKKNKA